MRRSHRQRRFRNIVAPPFKSPRFATYCLTKGEVAENEGDDVIRCDTNLNTFVIVDGSSRSYAPRKWAETVAMQLKGQPKILAIDWGDIGVQFEESLGSATSPRDSKLREVGSQATAIAMKFEAHDSGASIEMESIGDCFALVCGALDPDMSGALLWPFNGISEFPVSPHALSSIEPHVNPEALRVDRFSVASGDLVLLMSDALGRYACAEAARPSQLFEAFPFLRQKTTFAKWTLRQREEGRIEDDDLSMIVVWVP